MQKEIIFILAAIWNYAVNFVYLIVKNLIDLVEDEILMTQFFYRQVSAHFNGKDTIL